MEDALQPIHVYSSCCSTDYKVFQSQWFLCHSEANMRLPVINRNLDPISHRLAAIARTDFQGHPRTMIFISSERAYATSYK